MALSGHGEMSDLSLLCAAKRTAPAKARAKTVSQAATDGTHRELLVAMRTRIAKAVEDESTPAQALAALTKRLSDVAREIEAIDAAQESVEGGGKRGPVEDEPFDPDAL